MYDVYFDCPERYRALIQDYFNGVSSLTLEEVEEILVRAYESGEIPLSAYELISALHGCDCN